MTALDTGTEDLRAEIDGGVAVITMNRPDRRNAFSHAMVSALAAVLAQVESDEAVGCIVLTGAGGAFCAGGDVKNMAAPPADRGDGVGPSLDARIHRQRLNQRATSGRPGACRPSTYTPAEPGSWRREASPRLDRGAIPGCPAAPFPPP
jgi:2-(1,2-epoxy-1,2-dihydrophenyl)acetyl-CoA isomerase